MAALAVLESEGRTAGTKQLEGNEGRRAIGKQYRVCVTVDHAHCREQATQETGTWCRHAGLLLLFHFSSDVGSGLGHNVLTLEEMTKKKSHNNLTIFNFKHISSTH